MNSTFYLQRTCKHTVEFRYYQQFPAPSPLGLRHSMTVSYHHLTTSVRIVTVVIFVGDFSLLYPPWFLTSNSAASHASTDRSFFQHPRSTAAGFITTTFSVCVLSSPESPCWHSTIIWKERGNFIGIWKCSSFHHIVSPLFDLSKYTFNKGPFANWDGIGYPHS